MRKSSSDHPPAADPSSSIIRSLRAAVIAAHRPFSAELGREDKKEIFSRRRLQVLRQQRKFVTQYESEVLAQLADGSTINPFAIEPRIEIVCSAEQRRVFTYCRLLSLYPYSQPVGRRLSFLVRDSGSPSGSVLGIGCLCSPVRNISARDRWIGWCGPSSIAAKKVRLNYIADLCVCLAIPPYNHLLGGKLVALCAVSNEIREHYEQKYRSRYPTALLTTTAIFGQHTSVYNRLRFKETDLYTYVGETSGYGHLHIPSALYEKLRHFLRLKGITISRDIRETHSFRLKIISRAIRHLGLDERKFLRHNFRKGIFATPLAKNWKEFLLCKDDALEPVNLPLADLISHWKERWLLPRLARAELLRVVNEAKKPRLSAIIQHMERR